jgi:hypothetical protein
MCDNLMSEAELTVMAKVGSAGEERREELEEAVERAVEEGRSLMARQEGRSVDEFNDDSEYSKMLQEAVQVRALPLPAGSEGGRQSCDEQQQNHAAAVGCVGWSRGVGAGAG